MPENFNVPERFNILLCVKLLLPLPPFKVILVAVIIPLLVIDPAVVTLAARVTEQLLDIVKFPPAKVWAMSTTPVDDVNGPVHVRVWLLLPEFPENLRVPDMFKIPF